MATATSTAPDIPASCCAPTPDSLLDDAAAEQVAKVFKALGDPTRVKLLALITASAAGELCVCDLTAPVGLSQPTVSHHMKLLVDANLVSREQRGRWAYYRPTTEPLAAATRALTEAVRTQA